jgi:hypothetical protein
MRQPSSSESADADVKACSLRFIALSSVSPPIEQSLAGRQAQLSTQQQQIGVGIGWSPTYIHGNRAFLAYSGRGCR